jgi:hypothetical protein
VTAHPTAEAHPAAGRIVAAHLRKLGWTEELATKTATGVRRVLRLQREEWSLTDVHRVLRWVAEGRNRWTLRSDPFWCLRPRHWRRCYMLATKGEEYPVG